MKQPFFSSRLGALICCPFFLVGAGHAGEAITLEQAQAMRKDAMIVGEALDRMTKENDAVAHRKNVQLAERALGRITGQLDQVVDKLQRTENSLVADPYDGGKKYPAAAHVEIQSFDVPVGTTVVHVPVSLDKPSPNTVIAHVRVYDGEGGRADPDRTQAVIFRPGDPLTKTATFKVRPMREGTNVRAVQPSVPDGAERKGGGILITAREGAQNEPMEGGRAGLSFAPRGDLVYAATGQTLQFDDLGGPLRFSTSLVHGRTQPGNGETGYYGTVDMGGFVRGAEGLVLSSTRLPHPVKVGSPATEYPFLATVLSGHRTPETHFRYGTVEWVVKLPNRFGSWPALWLLPTGGWPPEIDVYEGFGYNGSWKFSSSLSTNLHGGDRQQRTFTRPAMQMSMDTFGLPATLDKDFHAFSVTVEPDWITMFVDGVETMCYANPFKGETWYPVTDVAVKAQVDAPYQDGTGAMTLRSLKVWKAE